MSLSTIEVICAPYTIWLADVGTAFPDVDESPAIAWQKLGHSGDKSYEEKGVTMTFNETLNKFRPAGGTGNRRVWRASEDISVGADLADLSPITFAKLMNDATVTQVAAGAGVAGTDSFALLKGPDVALHAAVIRGVSPFGPDFVAQFQLPIVYQEGNLVPVFSKAGAAMLAANLVTLEDDDLGFGEFVAQTGDAS